MDDRNVTTLERLRNDLFTYYNPTIAPQEDDEYDRTVEMNLDIKHFRLVREFIFKISLISQYR